MFDDSFLNFLRDEFPEQLGEINTAMNLLIDSIDETAAAVAARGNELSQDKEFKEAAVMMSRAAELQKISQRIKSYTDIFEPKKVTLVSEDEAIEDIEKRYQIIATTRLMFPQSTHCTRTLSIKGPMPLN